MKDFLICLFSVLQLFVWTYGDDFEFPFLGVAMVIPPVLTLSIYFLRKVSRALLNRLALLHLISAGILLIWWLGNVMEDGEAVLGAWWVLISGSFIAMIGPSLIVWNLLSEIEPWSYKRRWS